jgi:hypothetical protein
MKRILFAAIAAFLLGAGARADERFAGVWLLEPAHIDALIDKGVEIPLYPTLALRADGGFTLYQVMGACAPLDAAGREIAGADTLPAACRLLAEASRTDLGATLTRPSARGRYRVEMQAGVQRIAFAAEFRQVPEQRFDQILAEIRAASPQPELERQYRDLWQFPYLDPSRTVAVARTGRTLTLTFDSPARSLTFRAYARESLSRTAIVLDAFSVSYIAYFRCALRAVDAAQSKAANARTPNESRLLAMIDLAERRAAAREALLALQARGGVAASEVEAAVNRFRAAAAALDANAFVQAAQRDGLGRMLGCPERDRR